MDADRFNEVAVFIIMIYGPWGFSGLGAAYWNEQAARDEVERLNTANPYTEALYVTRWMPYPLFAELGRD